MIRHMKAKFRVVSVSENPNSFGLHGHILMNRAGEAWEVGRNRGPHNDPQWNKGDDIKLSATEDQYGRVEIDWAGNSCEIPRKLPAAPDAVVKAVFK